MRASDLLQGRRLVIAKRIQTCIHKHWPALTHGRQVTNFRKPSWTPQNRDPLQGVQSLSMVPKETKGGPKHTEEVVMNLKVLFNSWRNRGGPHQSTVSRTFPFCPSISTKESKTVFCLRSTDACPNVHLIGLLSTVSQFRWSQTSRQSRPRLIRSGPNGII